MDIIKRLAYVVAFVSLLELFLPRGPIPDSFGPWLWSAATVAIAGSPLDYFPTRLRWLFGLVIGYLFIFVVYSAAVGKRADDLETANISVPSKVFMGFTRFVLETVHFAVVSAAGCVLGFSVAMLFKQEVVPEFPLKPLFWGFVFANAVVMITGWGRPRFGRVTRPSAPDKMEAGQPRLTDF